MSPAVTAADDEQDPLLRVRVRRSGGQLPLLRPQHCVELAALAPEPAHQLRTLAAACTEAPGVRLRAAPAVPARADAFRYVVEIERASGTRTWEFGEADPHPPWLDELVSWTHAQARGRSRA